MMSGKRENKRQAIIDAALALLAEGGDAALTASALAARAGVSKANVFHHFPRLDDIVIEALETFLMGMPSMWPAPETPLRDWLMALGADTMTTMEADMALSGAYFAFVARARNNPHLRQRLAEITRGAQAHFEAVLAQLAPDTFTAQQRQALAGLILVAGDGLALHRQLFPERKREQAAAWRAFVEMIVNKEPER